jgi:hypothetical protein
MIAIMQLFFQITLEMTNCRGIFLRFLICRSGFQNCNLKFITNEDKRDFSFSWKTNRCQVSFHMKNCENYVKLIIQVHVSNYNIQFLVTNSINFGVKILRQENFLFFGGRNFNGICDEGEFD